MLERQPEDENSCLSAESNPRNMYEKKVLKFSSLCGTCPLRTMEVVNLNKPVLRVMLQGQIQYFGSDLCLE